MGCTVISEMCCLNFLNLWHYHCYGPAESTQGSQCTLKQGPNILIYLLWVHRAPKQVKHSREREALFSVGKIHLESSQPRHSQEE